MYSAQSVKCSLAGGLKTMTNFKIVIPHGGRGLLREVPTVGKFWCFGSVAGLGGFLVLRTPMT